MGPTANDLSGGHSRFTFSSCPLARLELMHQVPSLHFRGALSLEQRKLKSSSPALSQASCADGATTGEQEEPLEGQMVWRGGPGLTGDSRAEAWGHCRKADLRPGEAARGARAVHPETPTKLLTSLQSEFILK